MVVNSWHRQFVRDFEKTFEERGSPLPHVGKKAAKDCRAPVLQPFSA
jgi:hypothetical protein